MPPEIETTITSPLAGGAPVTTSTGVLQSFARYVRTSARTCSGSASSTTTRTSVQRSVVSALGALEHGMLGGTSVSGDVQAAKAGSENAAAVTSPAARRRMDINDDGSASRGRRDPGRRGRPA